MQPKNTIYVSVSEWDAARSIVVELIKNAVAINEKLLANALQEFKKNKGDKSLERYYRAAKGALDKYSKNILSFVKPPFLVTPNDIKLLKDKEKIGISNLYTDLSDRYLLVTPVEGGGYKVGVLAVDQQSHSHDIEILQKKKYWYRKYGSR